MTTEWSLDELYKGFDDPAYGKDVAELTAQIDALATLLADAGRMQEKERTEKVLAAQSGIAQLFYQLSLYVELRQSVNTEDGTVMAENAKLMKLQAKIAPLEAAAGKLLAGIRDVDALAKESGLVREHTFYLKEKQKEAKHLLSDEVEEMAASMNMSGGAAWSKLQSYLTSTVKVDYQGKQITLSEVRNLAYSPEASVRKSAYEAEIAAYEKVEDAIAVLNFVRDRFEPAEISLLGHSQGGVIAGMTAGMYADVVHSLVLLSPAASIKDDALRGRVLGVPFDPYHIPRRIALADGKHEVAGKYSRIAKTIPVYEAAAMFKGPAQAIQGEQDKVIDPSCAHNYGNAMANSSKLLQEKILMGSLLRP